MQRLNLDVKPRFKATFSQGTDGANKLTAQNQPPGLNPPRNAMILSLSVPTEKAHCVTNIYENDNYKIIAPFCSDSEESSNCKNNALGKRSQKLLTGKCYRNKKPPFFAKLSLVVQKTTRNRLNDKKSTDFI